MIRASMSVAALLVAFGAYANEGASVQSYQGDAAKGKEIATTVCAACHGPDGNSPTNAYPKIAGQHAAYLYKQMKEFKPGADGKPLRVNAIMNGMIAPYSDEQMKDLAAYFASQKQTGGETKRESLALGQKLWRAGDASKGVPACAGCHGPAGAGIPAQFPRLAGQYPEYTEAQLKAFRAEERANDPNKMMRMIAIKLTDKEIKAVADYAAGLH